MSAHKTLRHVLYAFVAILVFLFGGAALVLHSREFRLYALGKIIRAAQESTGTRIAVTDMNLSWYPLGGEFEGISARSRGETRTNRFLLRRGSA